jgi:predicted GNAT superfamily acetyltransferase
MRKPTAMPVRAGRPVRQTRVAIRALDRPDEFAALLDIQRRVWRHAETDLTPIHQFRITSRMGAILLGGYLESRLVGFVYSFPAVFQGRLVQHSHLLAVLPEFQGRGVGKTLKWAQRDRAVELGYDVITWTFDPLQARNANLNLHTLGAIARTYWPNFYGNQAALVLGPSVQTDRFLVEWRIRDDEVARRRQDKHDACRWPDMVRALDRRPRGPGSGSSRAGAGEPRKERGQSARRKSRLQGETETGEFSPPARPRLTLRADTLLAEVPRSVNELRRRPELIAAWQKALRSVFRRYLAGGYIVDDFIFGDRSFYVLRRRRAR